MDGSLEEKMKEFEGFSMEVRDSTSFLSLLFFFVFDFSFMMILRLLSRMLMILTFLPCFIIDLPPFPFVTNAPQEGENI